MLVAISTTHRPATDLGYLLHKAPHRVHEVELASGLARVFYPEATEERCTAVLTVEVDPVALVRRPKGREAGGIQQYVNDRPYAASSLLANAISRVYGTALGGHSRERPELAATAIPLEAHIPVLPCAPGEAFLREVFEPLGYSVTAKPIPLDPAFPEWGDSRFFDVRLAGTVRLQQLITHLYVLLPALDGAKHYWVGAAEVEKLLAKGAGWLEMHPKREALVQRYLDRGGGRFVGQALERLIELEGVRPVEDEESEDETEQAVEAPLSLNDQRLGSVIAALKAAGAKRVVDLGCGEGTLLLRLARDPEFEQLLGMDVTFRSVMAARAEVERLPARLQARVEVIQGSLLYADARIEGWDAATIVEVIEHLEPGRLPAFARVVFGLAKPRVVVVTTPNVEYNVRFEGMAPGQLRHPDHRFEWTREQFGRWAKGVAEQFSYSVRLLPIGEPDAEAGSPTQMAVFERWN